MRLTKLTAAALAALALLAGARVSGTFTPEEPTQICRIDRATGVMTCTPVRGTNPPPAT